MNQEQKEQVNLNLSRLRFLKTDATFGANSALGAVALSGISKLSERHLEDVLLQVPETLPNGGERSLSNYEVVPLRSEVIGVAPIQNNVIEVQAIPESNDIIGLRDLYVQLSVANSTISTVEDLISTGADTSGTRFISTSSFSNGKYIRQ